MKKLTALFFTVFQFSVSVLGLDRDIILFSASISVSAENENPISVETLFFFSKFVSEHLPVDSFFYYVSRINSGNSCDNNYLEFIMMQSFLDSDFEKIFCI